MPIGSLPDAARTADLVVVYRISDASYVKPRMPAATKEACLRSLLHALRVYMTERKGFLLLLADACGPETTAMVERTVRASQIAAQIIAARTGSNGASFRLCMDIAMQLRPHQTVYFCEDDYLHVPHALATIEEGLRHANFATGYDHPDKYGAQWNPEAKRYEPSALVPLLDPAVRAERDTAVMLGSRCHYRLTHSTTMTFACRVETLHTMGDVMREFFADDRCRDFFMFLRLEAEFGARLVHALPAVATHTEVPLLAPFNDWDQQAALAVATRFPDEPTASAAHAPAPAPPPADGGAEAPAGAPAAPAAPSGPPAVSGAGGVGPPP